MQLCLSMQQYFDGWFALVHVVGLSPDTQRATAASPCDPIPLLLYLLLTASGVQTLWAPSGRLVIRWSQRREDGDVGRSP